MDDTTVYLTDHIIEMVDLALLNVMGFKKSDLNMSPYYFFREFRLMELNLPRRSGCTTAAEQLAEKYKSIIITGRRGLLRSDLCVPHSAVFQNGTFRGHNIMAGRQSTIILMDNAYNIKRTMEAEQYYRVIYELAETLCATMVIAFDD